MADEEFTPIEEGEPDSELVSIPAKKGSFRWTKRRYAFCREVAQTGDVKQAAKNVGYSKQSGAMLITYQEVRDEVYKEAQRIIEASRENEDSVIARFSKWANMDIADFFEEDMTPKPLGEIDPDVRGCIKGIKMTRGAGGLLTVNLELHDAFAANKELANVLGMYNKDDGKGRTAEEQAQSIQAALKMMDDIDAVSVERVSEQATNTPTIN